MKIASVRFDKMVTVPGGRLLGAEMIGDACEITFTADAGWEIVEIAPGRFTLRAPHMTQAYVVGGYGFGMFLAGPIVEPVDTESPVTVPAKKAKR